MVINSKIFGKGKAGFIFVLAVWTLTFLSILAFYLGIGVRQKIILTRRLNERNTLRFVCQAGVKKAILELIKDEDAAVDSFNDGWANNELLKGIPLGIGKFSICYDYKSGADTVEIFGIVDESRKINVNKANLPTLKKLFELLGIDSQEAQNLAAAIVDFIDGDSAYSLPLGSAEESEYTNLSEPYNCKNSSLEVIDELLLVNGMRQDLFDKIKDFVTIYGDGVVNINTASKEVICALGIEEAISDKIIEYRKGQDGIIASVDDNIFTNTGEVAALLSQHYSLSSADIANLSNIIGLGNIGISSKYFMIRSVATLGQSLAKQEIIAVINRKGKVVFWREN